MNLIILGIQKDYYQKELDALTGSDNATVQKRAELESKLTQLTAQETQARIAWREHEKQTVDQMADLELQEVIARLKLRGEIQGQTEERIAVATIDRQRMAYQAELDLLNKKQNLSDKEILQKQKLVNQLTQLESDRVEAARRAWESEHQVAVSVLGAIGQAAGSSFARILGTQRQAKNMLDAIWLDIQNSVVNALANMLAQTVTNFLITQAYQMSATAATVATVVPAMAAIYAAALPAATMVSIASFGAADAAGLSAMLGAMAAIKAAGLAMYVMDEGGRLKPGQMAINRNAGDEIFMPEKNLRQIMRAEMIPQIRSDVVSGGAGRGIGIGIDGGLVSEIKEMHKTLKNMRIEYEIEGRKLKAVLSAQDKFDKRSGRK